MIAAIHQPNYLPWIGYFDKMDKSDIFILLDNVQHSKGSVTHRNQLMINGKAKYLSVPLKNQRVIINELIINNEINEMENHWRLIKEYYNKSPYWNYISNELEEIYSKRWIKLVDLNIVLIQLIKAKLHITTNLILASELKLEENTKSDRIIDICKAVSADIYLSGNGARAYNNEEDFSKNGIELTYQKFNHPIYKQHKGDFISNLSVLDLIFNCGPSSLDIIRNG